MEAALSPARAASNALLRGWAADITGRVLSLGSGQDQDKEGRTYRAYFSRASVYHTSEPVPSPHCDLVVDVRDMRDVPDGAYDAIFCSGVLEHVDALHEAVAECYRALSVGGVFLVGMPFAQPVHRAPQDFWRATEFGVRYLLRHFLIEALETIGPAVNPSAYWAKARKV